jgi:hypothetical protein
MMIDLYSAILEGEPPQIPVYLKTFLNGCQQAKFGTRGHTDPVGKTYPSWT